MVLEKILQCSDKIRELKSALESVNKDLNSKDMQFQQLMAERQRLLEHVHEKGKSDSVDDNGIIDSGHGKENTNKVHEN